MAMNITASIIQTIQVIAITAMLIQYKNPSKMNLKNYSVI